jgi:spermidine/putrescine transport system substrate-binding protein
MVLINVHVLIFANEAMEAKIRNGGTHYDVAFPSEYTVQKLKRAHLLDEF